MRCLRNKSKTHLEQRSFSSSSAAVELSIAAKLGFLWHKTQVYEVIGGNPENGVMKTGPDRNGNELSWFSDEKSLGIRSHSGLNSVPFGSG
jgi:hypothetical protein